MATSVRMAKRNAVLILCISVSILENCKLLKCRSFLQTEVFKIIHSMLVSTDSRDSCLTFMATVLQRNHRKAQLQVSQELN